MQWSIESLGEAQFLSPLRHGHSERFKTTIIAFFMMTCCLLLRKHSRAAKFRLSFEIAGPREKIFFRSTEGYRQRLLLAAGFARD